MQGQATIAVEHNFETAHRLPFLGGKCANLHGHSWKAKFHLMRLGLEGGVDENGISMDFASAKKVIRQWIDAELDHGTMLGCEDSLVESDIYEMMGKVFIFGTGTVGGIPVKYDYDPRPWPTVEAVAEMLCFKIMEQLGDDIWVVAVEVQETATNYATYTQAVPYNKDAEVTSG
jgi:6-pyruvoyltetrahydropterin/6-carboxytetrahydropterin synthase